MFAALAFVEGLGAGCSPAPGNGADVPGDRSDDAEAAAAPAGFEGDWRVVVWSATRAIGADFPDIADGGVESATCAETARASYRVDDVSIGAGGLAVRVNGSACEATAAGSTITARCGCGSSFVVCRSVLTLRFEGAPPRLRGEQRLDFNRVSGPAYCAVNAAFEAMRP